MVGWAQTAVESKDGEERMEDLETRKARQHKVIAESKFHRGVETGVNLWSTHDVISLRCRGRGSVG